MRLEESAKMPGEEIEIVPIDYALDAHRQALVELLDIYASEPIGGSTPLSADVRERLPEFFKSHPASRVWLAFVGGEAVGLATCVLSYSSFAARPLVNIHDLAVRPEYRGRGFGRALLEHVERDARATGCCGLTLEVRGDNGAAQKLYASCGFVGSSKTEPGHHSAFWKKRFDD
jgi:ribosomal protein S18 acetylase RimI-like enzyme